MSIDDWLVELFESAIAGARADSSEFCLVAVGSYARGELSFHSDLDLVLLHSGSEPVAKDVAQLLWYPLWDSGIGLDHSVRTIKQAQEVAKTDAKALTGLLDARSIAGDDELCAELRAAVHSEWRASAKKLVPELRNLVADRRNNLGEIYQLIEPDVKEAYGGLREAGIFKALKATQLVDVPHGAWEDDLTFLLDVRCALHTLGTKDKLRLQDQQAVAELMGISTAQELLREVYLAGRSLAYVSDVAWNRATQVFSPKSQESLVGRLRSRGQRGSDRTPLAQGVVAAGDEVALARDASLKDDQGLIFRVAAAAAENGYSIAPALLEAYANSQVSVPAPWTREIRESFVALLGSERSMLQTWEALENYNIISRWIPQWEFVRSLPQFNPLHEFTVDRHLVECCMRGQDLVRSVDRPDLLLVACLLHDIGKGRGGDHSLIGAELTREIAPNLGFDADDTSTLALLVEHHLLLADIATKRDLDDPVVIEQLCQAVGSLRNLELLHALTIADSRATGASLRSKWRENLMGDALRRGRAYFGNVPIMIDPLDSSWMTSGLSPEEIRLSINPESDGFAIHFTAPDQKGLLASFAGVLALNRLQVRAARVENIGPRAVQTWYVRPLFGEPPSQAKLMTDVQRVLNGTFNVSEQLARSQGSDKRRGPRIAPEIEIYEVSDTQTVLEVRAHDRKGLLFDITAVIAERGLMITGSKISTLGVDAVDVFFLRDGSGSAPSEEEQRDLAHELRLRLTA